MLKNKKKAKKRIVSLKNRNFSGIKSLPAAGAASL
jgi:hypothetical protein